MLKMNKGICEKEVNKMIEKGGFGGEMKGGFFLGFGKKHHIFYKE